MTEATLEKPAPATDATLPIESIKITANIRKHFEAGPMKELADNIARVGILEPLIVRPAEQRTEYILIAGERRLRAAKMANLLHVPVRILDVDEKEAAEIQAFENLHRQDLTPIEEARAFKMLLDAGGHTVEILAGRINKSVRHVYRAVTLLDLPTHILDQIEKGELTPAHGHQLLRVPLDDREGVFKRWTEDLDYENGSTTARHLGEFIDIELGTDLARAIFPSDKEYAGMIACKSCPFNSGNQGQLFDGAEKGKCLKKSCFDVKTEQVSVDCAVLASKKFGNLSYIGKAKRDYNGIKMTGALVISAELAKDPKAKKLLTEKPEKFAFAVVEPNWEHKKPEAILVCKDPALFRKMVPAARPKTTGATSSNEQSGASSARSSFIEKEVDKAIVSELIFKFDPDAEAVAHGIEGLLANMGGGISDAVVAALGLDEDDVGAKAILKKKLACEQLTTALIILAAEFYHPEKDAKKIFHLDAAKLVSKAKKEAAAAWDTKKTVEAAAKKTTAKAKK